MPFAIFSRAEISDLSSFTHFLYFETVLVFDFLLEDFLLDFFFFVFFLVVVVVEPPVVELPVVTLGLPPLVVLCVPLASAGAPESAMMSPALRMLVQILTISATLLRRRFAAATFAALPTGYR
jgi:hypothetical protein